MFMIALTLWDCHELRAVYSDKSDDLNRITSYASFTLHYYAVLQLPV